MKFKIVLALALYMISTLVQAEQLEGLLGWADRQLYSFAVDGVVQNVKAHSGDKVKQGMEMARLDERPYAYQVERCQAQIDQASPTLFDAKVDLDQADELFERSVLSEIELQRIQSRYKSLEAQQAINKAECKLHKWRRQQTRLIAREDGYVLRSNLQSGLVISGENRSAVFVETVSASEASANLKLSYEQALRLRTASELTVEVQQTHFAAKLLSLSLQADSEGKYHAVLVFKYRQPVVAGQPLKVVF